MSERRRHRAARRAHEPPRPPATRISKKSSSQPPAGVPQAAVPPFARIAGIDALRGAAVLAMVAYHFAFDLAWFKVTGWNFYRDPFWLHARTVILSSFLLFAGVSLVLADRADASLRDFSMHVGRIAACAVLVTAGSALLFPQSFIWFGVLHAMAVSLVLARPLVRRPLVCAALGVAVIVAGNIVAAPAFDARTLGWMGFATQRPVTEDYVPLFPWTGVLLVGVAVGHALAATGFRAVRPLAAAPAALRFLGRHSLAVYMIHQLLLIPLAAAVAWMGAGR